MGNLGCAAHRKSVIRPSVLPDSAGFAFATAYVQDVDAPLWDYAGDDFLLKLVGLTSGGGVDASDVFLRTENGGEVHGFKFRDYSWPPSPPIFVFWDLKPGTYRFAMVKTFPSLRSYPVDGKPSSLRFRIDAGSVSYLGHLRILQPYEVYEETVLDVSTGQYVEKSEERPIEGVYGLEWSCSQDKRRECLERILKYVSDHDPDSPWLPLYEDALNRTEDCADEGPIVWSSGQ
jgi:hypothetical protein